MQSAASASRRALVAAAFLAGATAGVFWPVVGHEFLALDDRHYVSTNPAIARGVTLEAVRWAATTTYLGNWHPLTWLSHALDVSLFGFSPGPHHFVNVGLHAAAATLLLLFLWRATGALWRSLVAAALFALHPLRVESVAWVAERKDVLSATTLMVTLLAYLAYARRPGGARYAVVVIALALGLMSKPMLVTVPLLLLILDLWPLGRLRSESWKRLALEKLPLAAMAAVVAVITLVAQTRAGAVAPMAVLPVAARVENAVVATVAYLGKAVWPHPLAVYYPLGESGPPAWRVAGAVVLLAALAAAGLLLARRAPYVGAGLAWYAVSLAPVSGIVQAGQQSLADRYAYIPLTGVFVLLAWGTTALAGPRQRPRALALLTAAVLGALVVVTRAYLPKWKDSMTLFTHAVEAVPGNWYMHYNLGILVAQRGDYGRAMEHYLACIAQRPSFWPAYNNLGQLQSLAGRRREAEESLMTALRLNPALAEARLNLGLLYVGQGRLVEAGDQYALLRRMNPDYAKTLGRMLDTARATPPRR